MSRPGSLDQDSGNEDQPDAPADAAPGSTEHAQSAAEKAVEVAAERENSDAETVV
jgi:hypothetical protein